MKRNTILTSFLVLIATLVCVQFACKTPESILNKSGAQLWGENCARCHNAPSPNDYKPAQWEVIGNHMKIRAGLTNAETQKIVEFLQSSSK
ncbi:MAG: c-type cytochrome [Bacteroidia bacterium]